MDQVIAFTPSQVIELIILISACISAVSVILGYVIKMIKATKKPYEDNRERINSIERTVSDHSELIEQNSIKINNIEQSNKITQRAILAMLKHDLDGNNTEMMVRSERELQDYLIDK